MFHVNVIENFSISANFSLLFTSHVNDCFGCLAFGFISQIFSLFLCGKWKKIEKNILSSYSTQLKLLFISYERIDLFECYN